MIFKEDTTEIVGYAINENGNDDFKKIIDSIDFGGKIAPEYRDAKLVMLAPYYAKDDKDAVVDIIVYGRILLYGVKGAIEKKIETPFLCQAARLLEVEVDEVHENIDRNREKLKLIRPVMMELCKRES